MTQSEDSTYISVPPVFKAVEPAAVSFPSLLVLLVCLILVALMPTVPWLPGASWHDRQRIGQIIVIALATATGLFWAGSYARLPSVLGRKSAYLIFGVVVIGVLSSISANQPIWAFTELATVLGSLGVAWFIAVMRIRGGVFVDRMLLGAVVVTCAALSIQVSVNYAVTIAARFEPVDPWSFMSGFSNLRFFGQFVSLTLPLLAAPILFHGRWREFRLPATLLLVVWWSIAISSGTRGTWLGLAIASSWLALMGCQARRWVAVQALCAMGGLVVFRLWMDWIPQLAGLEVAHHASSRLTSSLSGRETIWIQAANMIWDRPWLGYGPMHFADIANSVAAHPHQAWLQWASEWGVPSALAVTLAVGLAARAVFRTVKAGADLERSENVLRICLTGAMAASLTQAMVDGVLVMPYTEIWLAIVAGWLLALHPRRAMARMPSAARQWMWSGSLLVAAILLAGVLARDYYHLKDREEIYAQEVGGHLQPRFWQQGVIAAGARERLPHDSK